MNYTEEELSEKVKQNIDLVKRHLVDTIYKQAILAGVATTYADTELRHTFASNCIEVGMDVKSLSEMLGHSSVEITLNKYVHSNYKIQKNTLKNYKKFLMYFT